MNKLHIPAADESNPIKVMELVYKEVLFPVLKGAVEQGALQQVPPVFELLETAHVLPAPKGKTKPVIVRFRTRLHKGLMFQFKKEYAPSSQCQCLDSIQVPVLRRSNPRHLHKDARNSPQRQGDRLLVSGQKSTLQAGRKH